MLGSWREFLGQAASGPQPWLRVVRHAGLVAAREAFLALLSGRSDPAAGHVIAPR